MTGKIKGKNLKPQFILGYILAATLLLWSLSSGNFEFLFYAFTVLVLVFLVQRGDSRFGFNSLLLWGVDLWIVLHILGGLFPINGSVMYSLVLIELVGEPYSILKYDQLVHAYCYFIAALLIWQVMDAMKPQGSFFMLASITVLAASGIGGLNEIIEFTATVIVPETNVGGYENTAIDIVCNLVGALAAVPFFKRSPARSD